MQEINVTTDNATTMASKINGNFQEVSNAIKGGAGEKEYNNIEGFLNSTNGDVRLLWFSDIHGDSVRLGRIVSFAKRYSSQINDVICTGDIVKNDCADGSLSFWQECDAGGILTSIGNHDAYETSNSNWTYPMSTIAQSYNRFMAPYIGTWGVVSSGSVCYYYKDYGTVRLIVLDAVHMDQTQLGWIRATLTDARTNGKHVIIASHYPAFEVPYQGNKMDYKIAAAKAYDTDFKYLGAILDYHFLSHPDTSHNGVCNVKNNYRLGDSGTTGIIEIVQEFIDAGGIFVCYITGHRHGNMMRFNSRDIDGNTPFAKQLDCTIECGYGAGDKGYTPRVGDGECSDMFNVIAIRPDVTQITIRRCGVITDTAGRKSDQVTYDYGMNKILID